MVPLAEPAHLGIGLLEAGQVGGHAKVGVPAVAELAVQPENHIAAAKQRKPYRADILDIKLETVDDGTPRSDVDELPADADVGFIEQIAVLAIEVVESPCPSLAVGEILGEPAITVDVEFARLVDVGDGKAQVLGSFELAL